MTIRLRAATAQQDLVAVSEILDGVFGVPKSATMLRVGFMFDLLRTEQLVMLVDNADGPIGASVALRGRAHVELTHMAVLAERQGNGVGRTLFAGVTDWAAENDFDSIRWCVSPDNVGAVAAYLAWGARIEGWIDDAYGVSADSYNQGSTDRFVGVWRRDGWPDSSNVVPVPHGDHERLRDLLRGWAQIVSTGDGKYLIARHRSPGQAG
ncbi:MAG: GNAT family N-acetyltransferase [Pseudonocardiaceae bacterium]